MKHQWFGAAMGNNPVVRVVDQPSEANAADEEQIRFFREERLGEVTLVVSGEIDVSVADAFREQLHALVEAARSPALIDCSELSFVDSTGLSALMTAKKTADQAGVNLVLVAPSPFVRRVLDVTDLSSVFEIRD